VPLFSPTRNSFTTEYFIDAERFVERLDAEGRITQDVSMKALLNTPLQCDGISFPTIPKLKLYLQQRIQTTHTPTTTTKATSPPPPLHTTSSPSPPTLTVSVPQ
jgi:C2HE / C2H2 / C2HC zinc-binding finger